MHLTINTFIFSIWGILNNYVLVRAFNELSLKRNNFYNYGNWFLILFFLAGPTVWIYQIGFQIVLGILTTLEKCQQR